MGNGKSRFHQLSLVFSVVMVVFAFHTYIPQFLLHKELNFGRAVNFGIYALAALVFMVFLFLKETKLTRMLQVGSLIFFGALITAFVTPGEIGGDLMFIISIFLAHKYGLLAKQALGKLSLIVGILVVTRALIVVFDEDIALQRTIGQAVISLSAIPILYWLFEDESRRVADQKRELEQRVKRDRPFVEFGKNVGGIVHDFKNDLGLFSMFGQLMLMNKGEVISDRQLEEYQQYVHRFSSRIERILLITRIGREENLRKTELVSLIRSVLYVFQTNLDFRRMIHFTFQPSQEEIYLETIPLEVVSMLENIIRNSCEALVDYYGDDPQAISRATLLVRCTSTSDQVMVTVKDNGPGISACSGCGGRNCLECDVFELGKTTKETGNGIGLLNVKNSAYRTGAALRMKSEPYRGVTTDITFRLHEALTVEFPPQYTRSNQNN